MNEPTNAPSEKPTSIPSLPDSGGSLPLSQRYDKRLTYLTKLLRNSPRFRLTEYPWLRYSAN